MSNKGYSGNNQSFKYTFFHYGKIILSVDQLSVANSVWSGTNYVNRILEMSYEVKFYKYLVVDPYFCQTFGLRMQ